METTSLYSVYFPGRDTAVFFHGPFYELRRKFFGQGRTVRIEGSAFVNGIQVFYSGTMRKRSLRWELKAGKISLEKSYPCSGGYMIIGRSLNGNIVSRVLYTKEHEWKKSSYFAEGSTSRPILTVEATEDGQNLEITEYDAKTCGYVQKTLWPCRTETGTRAHSYLNAAIGEPCVYASDEYGDLCYYYSREDAEKRRQMSEDIINGVLSTVPLWTAEGGAEVE